MKPLKKRNPKICPQRLPSSILRNLSGPFFVSFRKQLNFWGPQILLFDYQQRRHACLFLGEGTKGMFVERIKVGSN